MAGMGEEEKKGKKRVVVESLGWLTESSIMPKKQREISGVGASSIMELKAQLYKSQEDAKKSKDLAGPDLQFHRAKTKIVPPTAKNSGVEARALKDKLELKAIKDGSVSYAALERKAQIYEKLVKGELSDEEENEKYCVDFFGKRVEEDESRKMEQRRDDDGGLPENEDGDGGNDNENSLLFNMRPVGLGRAAASRDIDEHKRFVREVHEEASEAREKASELKLRRQEQATSRREKLKQAYLRKQLEKLKAAHSTTEKT